ncbi:hypothetical protein [Curtobacterium sp. MCJR17_043]|uniref:hypothetical protein n=1 Tax=Curtobacterium sp. MCJR17_043 TaxID=2175660 RepID=UPI0024DFBE51|nr:hypothetical protein [Curtobacterium sp. MCJR17_043]WIB34811.1 hypothetical protein DEJ15_09535 [Curtobacterium sp. MCJR17_043]
MAPTPPATTTSPPWDVLLFDWEHNGVGNHVEFMVADLGNGYVQTFGANGSDSREARYRSRPKSYILGRFRPDWAPDEVRPHFPTTSIEHDTANHDEQDDDMTPEQDRRLKNIETMLGGVQNAIGDPKRGLATRLVAVLVIAQKLAKIAKVK